MKGTAATVLLVVLDSAHLARVEASIASVTGLSSSGQLTAEVLALAGNTPVQQHDTLFGETTWSTGEPVLLDQSAIPILEMLARHGAGISATVDVEGQTRLFTAQPGSSQHTWADPSLDTDPQTDEEAREALRNAWGTSTPRNHP